MIHLGSSAIQGAALPWSPRRRVTLSGEPLSTRVAATASSAEPLIASRRSPMANDLLLPRIAAGEEAAVSECLDRYGGLVYSLARRMSPTEADAADASQDIFVEVWRTAGRYDPTRAAESTWITTIARRRLIDRLRRRPAQPIEALPDEVADRETGSPALADPLEVADEVARVKDLLQTFGEAQRRCLELALLEGLSHPQISEQLDVPLGTVKTYIRRGMGKIRERLQKPAGVAAGGQR